MGEINYPLISIIIPVYNGSRYLREAIDSALGQSYPQLEVIVVNDGSCDEGATEKIALSYGNRIHYFRKENGGVSSALNLGIAKMHGEFFSWLSHDDVYDKHKIAAQIAFLRENKLKDTILFGGYALIDESSAETAWIRPESLYPEEKLNISLFALLRGLINGCTLLIHRSHFQRVGLFDESLWLVQDYALWFKMFRGADVRFHPGIYVKTRTHAGQQSHTKKDRTIEEGNALWISMIKEVTVEEMCALDGSPYHFYRQTAEFLHRFTPYSRAQRLTVALAEREKGKVSIIIPFFNRIPAVVLALQSILAQTYKNWEILLIDDGSTDDLAALRQIQDERLRYVRQQHRGASVARNKGISLASGEYIAFLDSDDLLDPQKLAKQIRFMESKGLAFSHTSYQRISVQGEPGEIIRSGRLNGTVFPRIIASCGISTSTVMLRREVLAAKRFKETIDYGEDVCLWIDIAYETPIGGIDEPLTKVRVSRNSSALNPEKQRIAYLNIAEHVVLNPHYRVHEAEIHALLIDFARYFKASTPIAAKPKVQSLPLVKPQERRQRQRPAYGYIHDPEHRRKVLFDN